jgi:hypothetical protein
VSDSGSHEIQRNLTHELELGWNKGLITAGFLERASPQIEKNQQKRHNQQANKHDSVQGKRGALKRNNFRVKLHDGGTLVITRFVGYRSLDQQAKCVI